MTVYQAATASTPWNTLVLALNWLHYDPADPGAVAWLACNQRGQRLLLSPALEWEHVKGIAYNGGAHPLMLDGEHLQSHEHRQPQCARCKAQPP